MIRTRSNGTSYGKGNLIGGEKKRYMDSGIQFQASTKDEDTHWSSAFNSCDWRT